MNDTTNTSTSTDTTVAQAPEASWWDHVVAFLDARDEMLVPIGIVLLIAVVLNVIQAWTLSRFASRMNRGGFRWSAVIASSLGRPLGFTIWIIALSMAIQMFIEPDPARRLDSVGAVRIGQIRTGLVLLMIGWFVARAVRSYERLLLEPRGDEEHLDVTIVHAVSNFLIVLVWLGVLLIALQTYGVNMTAIITLGGASSFALTFAFQDVFKNLFGGLMILFSRPFKIGDGIELFGKNIQGSVEEIGLYQSKVRGWDTVPYVIPNSMFLVNPIRNLDHRHQRRINFTAGLRYEDFDKVEPVIKDILDLLAGHEQIDSDATLRVNLAAYGASTLDINVLCFGVEGLGGSDFFALQQDLLLACGKIVSGHGADFAFPTTTVDFPGGLPTVPVS